LISFHTTAFYLSTYVGLPIEFYPRPGRWQPIRCG